MLTELSSCEVHWGLTNVVEALFDVSHDDEMEIFAADFSQIQIVLVFRKAV